MWIGAEAGPHDIRAKHLQLFWNPKLCGVPIGAGRNHIKDGFLEQLQASASHKHEVPPRRRSTTMQLHSLASCQARHHRPEGRGKVFTPVTDRSLRLDSVIHRRPTRGRRLLAARQGRGPVDSALRTGIASFFVSSVATDLRLWQGGAKPSHHS